MVMVVVAGDNYKDTSVSIQCDNKSKLIFSCTENKIPCEKSMLPSQEILTGIHGASAKQGP